MFLTICLFNEGMFAITAAKTKIQKITQKIPAVERDVKKPRELFYLACETINWYSHAEKPVGSSKVKHVSVS